MSGEFEGQSSRRSPSGQWEVACSVHSVWDFCLLLNDLCFPLLSTERPQSQVDYFCRYGSCWACLGFHNPPNSDMDWRILIMHTHVNACDRTRGCTDTKRESALTVDSGKKIICCTGESNLRQRRDCPML